LNNNNNILKKEKSGNTFRMLVKEDYSGYFKILKRIYPSFKFNHYNRISNEYFEYYKKYGEEGDIINRNYIKNQKKEGEYKKSNLLDILGVQENISDDPKKFKIKTDFLKRTDLYELNMIKEDLSFKTGVIDKELNHILESQANTLYNYIENNIDLNHKIDEFSQKMKNKIDFQKIIRKKYMNNSANLFLKENKKKQTKKLLKPLKILNELGKCMKELELISMSENENKIKQISDLTNIAKEKIKLLKKFNINSQKGTLLYEIENKIKNYENQGEVKLNDQFAQNFENLIKLCLIYNKEDEIYNSLAGGSSSGNKKNYNLERDKDSLKLVIQNENDFELIDENNNKYMKKNKTLLEENTKLKQKIKDLKDLYINKVNEFNNFQKIQELENIKIKESILIKIIKELCVIKDNFSELIKIISSKENKIRDNKDNILENIFNGIKLMNNNLEKIFINNNIQEFIPEIDSIFDPKTQDAIYKYEDKTKKDNSIGKVFSSGYKLNNKVFRHAKVAVIKNQERKLI
jgi:molecular chaperone GrpE (heat shock protein)